jgi:hypothetical protein
MRQDPIWYNRPSTSINMRIHLHTQDASGRPEERQAWLVVVGAWGTPIKRIKRCSTTIEKPSNRQSIGWHAVLQQHW